MRRLVLVSALISLNVLAQGQDCLMSERIVSREAGVISEVRNIQSNLTPWKNGSQKCTVTLEGKVNGQWAQGTGEFIWNEDASPKAACSGAVELAKKNLLNSLKSSTISNESVVVCKEQSPRNAPLINPPIGTIIDNPNRLRKHPDFPKPFVHNGEECRWYLETGFNGKDIKQFNGVVCKMAPMKWVIVDKF
jgi:hypothetical protein